jgi:hypothetical protein
MISRRLAVHIVLSAGTAHGGFRKCMNAQLNGEYLGGSHHRGKEGLLWLGFKGQDYSLKGSEMKAGPDKI